MHDVRIYKPDSTGELRLVKTCRAENLSKLASKERQEAASNGRCPQCNSKLHSLRHKRRIYCNDLCRDRYLR